ncbi:MAG TPA: hypothetical protein VGR07_05200 [Thermoanaerobaculia bacterium]|jgi:hypothetical protein|nr:hypothetical protein [Thermoanaerobaculia bacterium]
MENGPGTKRTGKRIGLGLLLVVMVFFLTMDLLPPVAPWLKILPSAVAVLLCAVALRNELESHPKSYYWGRLELGLVFVLFGTISLPDLLHALQWSAPARWTLLTTVALCGLISFFALARRRFA